jgi:hypothetical protein
LVWLRRLVPFAVTAMFAANAACALAGRAGGGALTGTWSGYIAGQPGSGVGAGRS